VTVEPGPIAALDCIGVANHLMAMAVADLAGIVLTGQAGVLAYPWLSSHFGAAQSGRATTAMNLVLFLCAFGAQYAIGAIIDLSRPARPAATTRAVIRSASACSSWRRSWRWTGTCSAVVRSWRRRNRRQPAAFGLDCRCGGASR
jgi:hypothetical protein